MKRSLGLRLLHDDFGGADVIGLVLITSLVAIGGLVGLTVIRDQVVQEFGDIAVALDSVDQSFSYTITVNNPPDPPIVLTASYADNAPTLTDVANAAPACIVISAVAPGAAEGDPLTPPSGAFP